MKQYFLTVLLLTTMTFAGTSQQLVIKPTVGINFTDFSKDPASGEFKAQVGWLIGGSVAIGKKIYVEPGIYYGKKSTEYQNSNSSADDVKFDISGIRVPMSVGINVIGNEKSPVGLHVFGGGSVFILTDIKDFSKDDFKSAAWGVFAGAGVYLTIFFVDLQYEWSLSNISTDLNNVDVGKTRSLFLHAGVKIGL